ncbi:MAG: hypothetical protein RSH52_05980 [Janthinobacterium sp.]
MSPVHQGEKAGLGPLRAGRLSRCPRGKFQRNGKASFRAYWPGAVWLSVIVVYAALVPLVPGLDSRAPARKLAS